MESHKTLILTHRGAWQQQALVSAAPSELDITVLRDAQKKDILRVLPKMEFLISEREEVIDAEMIAAGGNLRLIQRLGAQTWDIDKEAARRANIPVCYFPDQGCVNVAEHMIMAALDLLKNARDLQATMQAAEWTQPSKRSDEDTFAYNWTGRSGSATLRGATAGILGFGEIGRELSVRLRAFETKVLYHKRRRMPPSAEEELGVTYLPVAEMIGQCDVVFDLLPYSAETAQGINAAFFQQMKPGATFIFAGGSGGVNEDDLIAALKSGKLRGAALDTFTYEPLPTDSPLIALARDLSVNLILTPHVAAGTSPGEGRSVEYTNLRRLLRGEPLLYRVA